MEESDSMLISSLKDFVSVPEDISTLRDIRTDQIYDLSLLIFDALRAETAPIKAISRTQRFRSMTKLTQALNKEMDTQFELNDIMNPTLPFLRKLLLAFISRLGAFEGDRTKLGPPHSQTGTQQLQRQALSKWIGEPYICPELRDQPRKVRYQPHRLRIQLNKGTFRRDLCSELINVGGNAAWVLNCSMARHEMERRKREAEEGISKKKEEENQSVVAIVKNNLRDWAGAEKTISKMKKRQREADADKKDHQGQQHSEPMSIFQQEVSNLAQQHSQAKPASFKAEIMRLTPEGVHSEASEGPLSRIRDQCDGQRRELESRLQQLFTVLSEKKEGVEEKEGRRKKIEEKRVKLEERAGKEKEGKGELKKKAEKKRLMLGSLEGGADLEGEVRGLEEEVGYLEREGRKEIEGLRRSMEEIKKEGARKMEVLGDLKLKLSKIEWEYQSICGEIEDKLEIKARVRINQSGLSRTYYSKKITDMEARCRDAQREANKNHSTLSDLKEQVRRGVLTADRLQTEVENLTNAGKLRAEPENIAFKDLLTNCSKTFKITMKAVEQINETKAEVQDYEMKVHSLSGKDYKDNIRRLEVALEELKKEMGQVRPKD